MKPEYDPELEAIVDRELRNLQDLPAPPTLVPRVLARLQPQPTTAAWWQQPWWRWPLPARLASCLLTVGVLVALADGSNWIETPRQSVQASVGGAMDAILAVAQQWLTGLLSMAPWPPVSQAQWLVILTLIAGSYLACIAMGTLVVRTALKHSQTYDHSS